MSHAEDSVIREMIERYPLTLFSPYTQMQFTALCNMRDVIILKIDGSFLSEPDADIVISHHEYSTAYEYFWFWILGAYEMVRTMVEKSTRFDESVLSKLKVLKKDLSAIRMPFAKQQLEGKKRIPITVESSIYGMRKMTKDFSFLISGREISMKETMQNFVDIISSIRPENILDDSER